MRIIEYFMGHAFFTAVLESVQEFLKVVAMLFNYCRWLLCDIGCHDG